MAEGGVFLHLRPAPATWDVFGEGVEHGRLDR